jgi:hypothetical protein
MPALLERSARETIAFGSTGLPYNREWTEDSKEEKKPSLPMNYL